MDNQFEHYAQLLLETNTYPHPCQPVTLVETHISKVYLTGDFAYKIKKPVNFGFLDFSKLEDRKHYCEEEIRLNSRLAPQLYLQVVAIGLQNNKLNLEGKGEIIEYAVKMKQFDTGKQLDRLHQQNKLALELAPQLANIIAEFHQKAQQSNADSRFGTPQQVLAPMIQNFEQIRPLLNNQQAIEQLEQLQQWTEKSYSAIEPLLRERKQQGFIRECHGDMHLGNMTLYQDKIQIFDGIEFNDDFRWIDTASEIAFFCMDLEFNQAQHFANVFLNDYLACSGDYKLLQVLDFYKVYRALVRAKIALLTASQMQQDSEQWRQQQQLYQSYIQLAQGYTQKKPAHLVITHGISGSGKSWISRKIAEQCGFIQLRSDKERKRHFDGLPGDELYSKQTTEKVYALLLQHAQMLLDSGYSVVVDATFLQQAQRQAFIQLARQKHSKFTLLSIQSDEQLNKSRITQRQQGFDVSDADIEIMQQQQKTQQEITTDEQKYRQIIVNTPNNPDLLLQLNSLFCPVNPE